MAIVHHLVFIIIFNKNIIIFRFCKIQLRKITTSGKGGFS